MENIIGPSNNQSKMFTFLLYSHDLRKGLDRLMIARKMSTKREAQMRGYLLVLFVTKIISGAPVARRAAKRSPILI